MLYNLTIVLSKIILFKNKNDYLDDDVLKSIEKFHEIDNIRQVKTVDLINSK